MQDGYLLREPEAWRRLAENLEKCKKVVDLNHDEERESWTMAHAFADLEGSFRRILDAYLPKLMAPEVAGEDVHDVLLDIGEELRHILYHIKDTRFFAYIDEAGEGG